MGRTLHTVLNEANPNKIPSALQDADIGNVMGRVRVAKVTVASNVATLPDNARALAVLGGVRTAGTATGPLTGVTEGVTLAAGQARPRPDGNLEFFGTDAVTAAEVTYLAHEGEVVERSLTNVPATGHVLGGQGAQILVGATIGGSAATILARGGTTPSAGEARLSLDGSTILLPSGVTAADVQYVPFPDETVDQALRKQVGY